MFTVKQLAEIAFNVARGIAVNVVVERLTGDRELNKTERDSITSGNHGRQDHVNTAEEEFGALTDA